MARDYELGIVISPDVGDEQARAIVERITQVVQSNDGQVVRVNAWGRRRLAYSIDHHRDGLYFFFDLILPPTSIVEIERALRVNEDVIRHLLKLRDPRVIAQERQRDADAEARAVHDAEVRAAEQAAAAARAEAESAAAAAAAAEGPAPEATPAPATETVVTAEETATEAAPATVPAPATAPETVATAESAVSTPAEVETAQATEPEA